MSKTSADKLVGKMTDSHLHNNVSSMDFSLSRTHHSVKSCTHLVHELQIIEAGCQAHHGRDGTDHDDCTNRHDKGLTCGVNND